MAGRRLTRNVRTLAVDSCVSMVAVACVRPEGVRARAVLAWPLITFVHVRRARVTRELGRARAPEGLLCGVTGGPVATRLGGAVVHLLAFLAVEARGTLAPVGVQRQQLARGAVEAGVGVAGVGDGDFAQGRPVPDGAQAVEFGDGVRQNDVASAAVLAARARAVPTGIRVLAVLSDELVGTFA